MRHTTRRAVGMVWVILLLVFVGQLFAKPSFKWGVRERVRHTYMNNNIDFNADSDDEQGFFRIRTNLWGQADLGKNWSAKLQLANEFREFFPENKVEYFVSYYDYYQPEA